jgi:subtilase family serine protease
MLASFFLNAVILLSPSASAAQPDLNIESIYGLEWFDVVTVTVVVENLGDATSPGFYVDLYGSENGRWLNAGQNTHYDVWVPYLSPGESVELDFDLVDGEWGGASGGGTLYAAVDVDARVGESDESNNMARVDLLLATLGEPALVCGNSSTWYRPLEVAPFMNRAFIVANSPFLRCKSRGLF